MTSSANLHSAIIDRMAAGWIAFGCPLEGPSEETVVDPEALVAVTVELGTADPRIFEAALAWCAAHGQFINSTRLRRVAAEMGTNADSLASFAGSVAASGGPAWPMAQAGEPAEIRYRPGLQDLASASTLVWRARAAFGVNVRADIISALLTAPVPHLTVAELAQRTRFGKRNVAQALIGMNMAGVVEIERRGNQDHVQLGPGLPVSGWLATGPRQPDWPSRWRVGLVLLGWDGLGDSSAVVRAVEARTLVERLAPVLSAAALPKPDLRILGVAFADEFDSWLSLVAAAFRTLAG